MEKNIDGCRFRSSSGRILSGEELRALARGVLPNPHDTAQRQPWLVRGAVPALDACTCGSAVVYGVRMHMPEMVFGSWMEIEVAAARPF